jgi:transposase InsO family protein
VRFQFIEDHGEEFPTDRMCRLLDVSCSGYYAWRGRLPSEREMANEELYKKIEAVYDRAHKTYGSPRVYQELKRQGITCSENRVARLMRLRGLRAIRTRTYKTTTRRNKAHPVARNILRRDFGARHPDRKWVVDITYIPTAEGWLYLAVVLDLYSRRVVGWAMSERMTAELTMRALRMALNSRLVTADLIHHSDQGSQYTDGEYQQMLKDWGVQVSMNGVGSWYDNAPIESFFGTLKSEWVHHRTYRTRQEARADIFYYIEAFYNPCRLHSALGYLSPAAFEALYRQSAGLA